MAAFFVAQVSRQIALDLGREPISELIGFIWIGICIYTWVGPGIFRRKLQEELAEVRFKDF